MSYKESFQDFFTQLYPATVKYQSKKILNKRSAHDYTNEAKYVYLSVYEKDTPEEMYHYLTSNSEYAVNPYVKLAYDDALAIVESYERRF